MSKQHIIFQVPISKEIVALALHIECKMRFVNMVTAFDLFLLWSFTFVARQELYGVESMGKSRCHCHRPQHNHYHDFDHNQQPLLPHYEGDI
uniref:Uncharacterized protein n=1 Tax=Glossina palpalis gambiensis TaxID=67801 RepID=A0A1B0BSY5_9MUSC